MHLTELTDEVELRIRELDHRVKNIIAIVRWITMKTLDEAPSLEQAKAAIDERLASLGGAIDQLLSSAWTAAPLPRLAEKALNHFGPLTSRISLEGQTLNVGPKAAMTLALALNELATNAVKYGALSEANGRVELSWNILESEHSPSLWMQWAERDGPRVSKPERQGFGTRLICSAVSRNLRGRAGLDFLPTGVVWTLFAPLAAIAQ